MSEASNDDLAAQVTEVREQVDRLAKEQARAEAEESAARAEYERARNRLQEQFGVADEDEAQRRVTELDREIASELAEVRTALDAANTRETIE